MVSCSKIDFLWSTFARQDLKDIHDYISIDSAFYADRFIDKIIQRIEILIDSPMAGRMVPEIQNQSVRELVEGNYRIIE